METSMVILRTAKGFYKEQIRYFIAEITASYRFVYCKTGPFLLKFILWNISR